MPADLHVVRNMHLAVDLDPVGNHRIADGTAVDRRTGTHLDIVTQHGATDLRHLDPGAFIVGQTEPVCADHHTRMDQTTLAEPGVRSTR